MLNAQHQSRLADVGQDLAALGRCANRDAQVIEEDAMAEEKKGAHGACAEPVIVELQSPRRVSWQRREGFLTFNGLAEGD